MTLQALSKVTGWYKGVSFDRILRTCTFYTVNIQKYL